MEQPRSLFVGTMDLMIFILILKGDVFAEGLKPIFYIIPLIALAWFGFGAWKNLFARPIRE